jgi:hypothetical protein
MQRCFSTRLVDYFIFEVVFYFSFFHWVGSHVLAPLNMSFRKKLEEERLVERMGKERRHTALPATATRQSLVY